MITIEFLKSSFLRLKPQAIRDQPESSTCTTEKGLIVGVKGFKPAQGLFILVTFDRTFKGRNTWLVYGPDIKMMGTEPTNTPQDRNVDRKAIGIPVRVPGISGHVLTTQPIISGGHFTWGEATHGGTRPIDDLSVAEGVIRIAKALELVRAKLGNAPISINSWYRDPRTNAAVGGASQSRHMEGDAVDFVIVGRNPHDIYQELSDWWGARGGLASSSVFTHIDTRSYWARWDYGF